MDRNHSVCCPDINPHSRLVRRTTSTDGTEVWRRFHRRQWQYKWVHKKCLSMARLDRFFFKHHFSTCKGYCIVPVCFTDHCLVQCSLFLKNTKTISNLHFNTALLKHNGFKNNCTFFWRQYTIIKTDFRSLQQCW